MRFHKHKGEEITSVKIENATRLRQPEVSIAMRDLTGAWLDK